MSSNAVTVFVEGVAERAVKSAAQSALAAYVGQNVDLVHGGWQPVGLAALTGLVLSVLTSLASQPFGSKTTPSLVPVTTTPAATAATSVAPTSTPVVSPASSESTSPSTVPTAIEEMDRIFPAATS